MLENTWLQFYDFMSYNAKKMLKENSEEEEGQKRKRRATKEDGRKIFIYIPIITYAPFFSTLVFHARFHHQQQRQQTTPPKGYRARGSLSRSKDRFTRIFFLLLFFFSLHSMRTILFATCVGLLSYAWIFRCCAKSKEKRLQ